MSTTPQASNPQNTKPSKGVKPLLDLSESAAGWVYSISWAMILLGAAIGTAGALGQWWGERILTKYTDERISENERKTAEAVASAATANESAEKTRQENLKLSLDLEWERRDREGMETRFSKRDISFTDLHDSVLEGLPGVKVMLQGVPEDEPRNIGLILRGYFLHGKWELIEPTLCPFALGGITVEGRVGTRTLSGDAARALVAELKRIGLKAQMMPTGEPWVLPNGEPRGLQEDTIRVVVGRSEKLEGGPTGPLETFTKSKVPNRYDNIKDK